MEHIGLIEKGNRYKGNLHSHTTASDGKMSPQETVEAYKGEGYHFMSFTDHEVYIDWSEQFNEENFILIPGIEASAVLLQNQEKPFNVLAVHHILGILGTKEMQEKATLPLFENGQRVTPPTFMKEWDSAKVAQELVDSLADRGLFVVYNHPLWSRIPYTEYKDLKNLWALEVYNNGSEVSWGLGTSFIHWDSLLAEKKELFSVSTDDNHNKGANPDSFGGYVVVLGEELTQECLAQNLAIGNFYSSTGVEIQNWGIKDGKAYVECSDVRTINFIVGGNVGTGKTIMSNSLDETINYGEYLLPESAFYLRVECIDKYGRRGWTNPYYIKKEGQDGNI